MNTKEKIEIMQAYLDGKTIQFMENFQISDEPIYWSNCIGEPKWNFIKYQYRIKPKEKVKKTVKYLCFEQFSELLYLTKEDSSYHLRFKADSSYTRIPEFDMTREIEVEE